MSALYGGVDLVFILEMKFIEGRSAEIAATGDVGRLYRKQRVAVEEVAHVILEMERQMQVRVNGKEFGEA